jgi:hypothetical protein
MIPIIIPPKKRIWINMTQNEFLQCLNPDQRREFFEYMRSNIIELGHQYTLSGLALRRLDDNKSYKEYGFKACFHEIGLEIYKQKLFKHEIGISGNYGDERNVFKVLILKQE